MAKEIVYWRGQGEPVAELLNGIREKSYAVLVTNSLDDILDRLRRIVPALIIVDATSAETEVGNRVVQLSGAEKLYDIPLLFLGRQATARTDILARQYEHFFPVDSPLRVPVLLKQIKLICSTTDLTSVREQIQRENLEHQKSQRTAVDPKQLSASFGGRIFAESDTLADFDDQKILPKHPKREVLENAMDQLTKKDEQLGVHIRRVSFASSALANKLKFSDDRDSNVRTVSLLLNEGLYRENPALTKVDFTQLASDSERQAIAAGFRRSADFMMKELSDPLAARTTAVIADLLLGKNVNEDPRVIEEARCAFAAESMDRACWGFGKWNPQGAYRMMRGLQQDPLIASNPAMAETLVRFLGEAVDAHKDDPTIFTPQKPRTLEQKKIIDLHEAQAKKEFSSSAQVSVDFPHLQPGMRLARPLLSKDGKLILPANTELDKDLVYRLLQLASIRPMNTPIVLARSIRNSPK